MKHVVIIMAAIMVCAVANAQERAAGGTLGTQMTWSALSSKIGQVDGKIGGVKSLVDQSIVCGHKGMMYAPGGTGIDSQGCKLPNVDLSSINTNITNLTNSVNSAVNNLNATNSVVNNIINCNRSGQIFNGSQCTSIASGGPSIVAVAGSGRADCPAGTTIISCMVSGAVGASSGSVGGGYSGNSCIGQGYPLMGGRDNNVQVGYVTPNVSVRCVRD